MVSTYPPTRCRIALHAAQNVAQLRSQGHVVDIVSPDGQGNVNFARDLRGGAKLLRLFGLLSHYDRVVIQYQPEFFYERPFSRESRWQMLQTTLCFMLLFLRNRKIEIVAHEIPWIPGKQGWLYKWKWKLAPRIIFRTPKECERFEQFYDVRLNRSRIDFLGRDEDYQERKISSEVASIVSRLRTLVTRTVAIAIPSLHRPDLTSRCIDFIQRQTLPADEWEIIVIENAAQPGKILADPLPRNTRRIELPSNEGTTGSINRAVAASDSRYILLLNNDVELAPDYIEKLVAALDATPKAGFAVGKLLRAGQRTHLDGAGDAMLMAGAAYRLGHLDQDRGQFDQEMPVLAGCGAAVLYRREAFVGAGGLDPAFFAYLDDLDLALRAHLLGYGGVYLPHAVAYHIGSATLGEPLHPRAIELITRNQLYLLMKDYPRAVLRRLMPRILVYQCLWLILVLRNRAFGAYLRAVRDAFRSRRSMQRMHRELMALRRISDAELLERLRASERQIYDWQQSLPPQTRSALLKFYFALFGRL
jgi:GT2 family glycosyltransferase